MGMEMTQYLIMCKSLTSAQRAGRLLERSGISANVTKAPQGLSTAGCGYALSLYRHLPEAMRLLHGSDYVSGKVFVRSENGRYEPVIL